uniref:Putative secreted protein n=1 Tax=Ixodes ricinus TaxID=34613 RepID=A0A6B0UA91_IXORI
MWSLWFPEMTFIISRVILEPVEFLSATTTVTPSRARTRQTLLPIPLAPPVTIASLPCSPSEESPAIMSGMFAGDVSSYTSNSASLSFS